MKMQNLKKHASDIAVNGYINGRGYYIDMMNSTWSVCDCVLFLTKGDKHAAIAICNDRVDGTDSKAVNVYEFEGEISFGWYDEENIVSHEVFYRIDSDWFTDSIDEYKRAKDIAKNRKHAGRNIHANTAVNVFAPSGEYEKRIRGMYGFKAAKQIRITRTPYAYVVSNDKNNRTHKVEFDKVVVSRTVYAYPRHQTERRMRNTFHGGESKLMATAF